MRCFGKGWIKSVRPFPRTFAAHRLTRAAAVSTTGIDMVQFSAPMMDQRVTSACTGHATSDGCFTAFGGAGKPLLWIPSQTGIYTIGRAETRDDEGVPLTDDGAMPADIMKGIGQWGIRAMGPASASDSNSDADPSTINDEPALDDLESDDMTKVESYGISPGLNAPNDVLVALSGKLPVPTGFFVDTAFEEWVATQGFVGAPKNPNDPAGGGHYVDCVGFTYAGLLARGVALPARMAPTAEEFRALVQAATVLPSTDPIFFFKNSWNVNWGLRGFFLATKGFLLAPQCSDCNAIEPVLEAA